MDYDWSMNALNVKIKDLNQGGWPQIMPSSAKPGQAQPEAVRFSQLKKKNFWGFSPLVLTIERPLQIYQEVQDFPKGSFQNLESNFFAYMFLLSHRFCQGRSSPEKKIENFLRVRNQLNSNIWNASTAAFKSYNIFLHKEVGSASLGPRYFFAHRDKTSAMLAATTVLS